MPESPWPILTALGLPNPPSHMSERHSLLADPIRPFAPEPSANCRLGIMNDASIFPLMNLVQKWAMAQNVSSFRVYPVYPYVTMIGIPRILRDITEDIVSPLTLPSPVVTRRHGESGPFLLAAPAAVGAYRSLPRYPSHGFRNPNPSGIL